MYFTALPTRLSAIRSIEALSHQTCSGASGAVAARSDSPLAAHAGSNREQVRVTMSAIATRCRSGLGAPTSVRPAASSSRSFTNSSSSPMRFRARSSRSAWRSLSPPVYPPPSTAMRFRATCSGERSSCVTILTNRDFSRSSAFSTWYASAFSIATAPCAPMAARKRPSSAVNACPSAP